MHSPDTAAAVHLTADLVRLNTTNPPGEEGPAIDLLAERLRRAGFAVRLVPYLGHPNRRHLVARLHGSGERPGLMFSGHVDVVPPGEVPWSVPPFGGEIREGRLFGRGSCDMKSGVAALVVAAETVAASGAPLRGDLVVAITADEERYCLGAAALVHEPLFDGLGGVLVAEPTGLELFIAEKGCYCAEVTCYGRTAHGSMPELGANAVQAMAAFLVQWEEVFADLDPGDYPLLGHPTLNVGVVQGGVKANVVPDRCTAQLDMRTTPALDHALLRAALERTLAETAGGRRGIRTEFTLLFERPAVSCPPDSPLALALARHAPALAGVDPAPRGVPYCTEACIWVPDLGIPAVICGPGAPGMAHQPDECVPVAHIEAATRLYTAAAVDLLC